MCRHVYVYEHDCSMYAHICICCICMYFMTTALWGYCFCRIVLYKLDLLLFMCNDVYVMCLCIHVHTCVLGWGWGERERKNCFCCCCFECTLSVDLIVPSVSHIGLCCIIWLLCFLLLLLLLLLLLSLSLSLSLSPFSVILSASSLSRWDCIFSFICLLIILF